VKKQGFVIGRVPRRVVCAAAAVLVSGGMLVACGASPSSSASKKPKTPFTIAFVPGEASNVFYDVMEGPAKTEAAKLGMKVTWEAGEGFSAETQIPVVQALLAKHPSALIIAPTDPVALQAPIASYVKAGIPVFEVDTSINDTKLIVSQITSDNYQGGELAAKLIGQRAHGKGTVFVMGESTAVTSLVLRQQGFDHEIKTAFPGMTLLPDQYDNASETTAATLTSSLLIKYPGLVGIFGANNTTAEGVASSVDKAGEQSKLDVIAYDADPTEVGLLKQSVLGALIIQQPGAEAKLAVQYVHDYLTGKKSLVKKSVKLPNVTATTANADKSSVAKYFYAP
jgi:ABC-type sugar transport system substrate-binding protein